MKQYFTLLLLFFFQSILSFGQTTYPKQITIDKAVSGNQHYEARDAVHLKPGFNYRATAGNAFRANVNSNLLSDAEYISSVSSESFSFNKDLEVGGIEGSWDVSITGAAIYNIPIFVSPGTEGVQPQVSIGYSSRGSNGIMGIGWNINNLSSITRVPRNYYHDGTVNQIDFSYDDRFVLDSNRLISISGIYGKAGTVYATEVETFSVITSYGVEGNGPQWFKVETKDGWIFEYGRTADSRVKPLGSSTPMSWNLNKAMDPHGNYIRYVYNNESGESRIDRIEYTGNESISLQPYNSVNFYYEKRADEQISYINGYEIAQRRLLSSIKIFSESTLVREYKFHYSFDGSPRLSKISEQTANGKQINPTLIEWEKGSGIPRTITNTTLGNQKIYTGDFNGDGRTDILTVIVSKYGSYETIGNYNYHLCNKDGVTFSNLGSGSILNLNNVKITDLNGDGKDDVIFCMKKPRIGSNEKVTGYDYNYQPRITNANNTLVTINNTIGVSDYSLPNQSTSIQSDVIIADFDGDGINDQLYIKVDTSSNVVSWEMFSYGYKPYENPNNITDLNLNYMKRDSKGSGTFSYTKRFSVIDLNGDGRSELVLSNDNEIKTYKYQTGDFQEIGRNGYPSNMSINIGDFNGDGLQDILLINSTNKRVEIYYSKGDGTFKKRDDNPFPLYEYDWNNNERTRVYDIEIHDFNGDGIGDVLFKIMRFDVIGMPINGFVFPYPIWKWSSARVFLSNKNNGYDEEKNIFEEYTDNDRPEICFGDFDGDGKTDICYWNSGDSKRKFLSFNKGENKNLIIALWSGDGTKTTIDYKRINESNYVQGSAKVYPIVNYNGPLYVVASLNEFDGRNGTLIKDYSYEDANVHRQGKGFLGFSTITMKDRRKNIVNILKYNYNPNYFNVTLKSSETYITKRPGEKTLITHKDEAISKGGKRFFPYTKQILVEDYRFNKKQQTDYEYDNNGNLIKTTNQYFGTLKPAMPEYADVKKTGYKLISGTARLYKPSADTLTLSRYGSNRQEFITKYEYYENNNRHKGRIKEIYDENQLDVNTICKTVFKYTDLSDGLSVRKYFENDRYGIMGDVTEYYEPKGRWIRKVSGEYDTIYNYDSRSGNLLSETTPDGLTTLYQYDDFGNLIRTTYPDGNHIDTEVRWASNVSGAVYYKKTTPSNGRVEYEYYDQGKKVIQTHTTGDGGINIYTDMVYNLLGQMVEKDITSNKNALSWILYKYDDYGRIKSEIHKVGDGTRIYDILWNTYGYNDNERTDTIIDELSKTTTIKKYDSKKNIISSSDPGGNITYEYWATGDLKWVSVLGSRISLAYDQNGNRISINDPNAGRTTCKYDHLGFLRQQADANGTITTYGRNSYGRLENKIISKGSFTEQTDYIYNSKGWLETVRNPVSSITYNYDLYGKTTQMEEQVDGMSFKTNFVYDNKGNLIWKSFPGVSGTRFEVNYNYFDGGIGNLESISKVGASNFLWKTSGSHFDEWGRPVRFLLGNGLQIRTSQDYEGQPLSIQVGKEAYNVFGNFVQSWVYSYNSKRLMQGRIDKHTNQEEQFEYDNLSRLTKVKQKIGSGSLFNAASYDYNQHGNMEYRTDVGAFFYEAEQVNAPSMIVIDYDDSKLYHNNVSFEDCITEYTPFHKIKRIIEGRDTLLFVYGHDEQRIKTVWKRGNDTLQKKYFIGGDYEYEVNYTSNGIEQRELNYIGADYFTGVYVNNVNTNVNNLYYIHEDHLGSFERITNEQGVLVDIQSFDAWGNRRNPYNWQQHETEGTIHLFSRGFTGHEHLDQFRIINMNGRLYDPVTTRFFSPDPFVQFPEYTQNYNRYSYALNNPLKFIDPSGEKVQLYEYLKSTHQSLGGMSRVGESFEIGGYTLVPFYSVQENRLLGYNAGRIGLNGEYRTEYQMLPTDLKDFTDKIGFYTDIANIVYISGKYSEYANFGTLLANGDRKGAMQQLGRMWKEAASDPMFFVSLASSVAGTGTNIASKSGNLGNRFKNSTLSQVDNVFQAHVKSGKLQLKYVNPKTGAKAYQNTKSGYSYNLDPGGMYGKKFELPHIDVNYPNPKPLNVSPKKKLPVIGGF